MKPPSGGAGLYRSNPVPRRESATGWQSRTSRKMTRLARIHTIGKSARPSSPFSAESAAEAPIHVPLKYPMPDTPLWSDDDQTGRLSELTADTSDPAKELPLRRDVRSLGMLLGRVLVEQEGEAFYEVVERLRRLLIQHREQHLSGASGDFDDRLMAQAREIIRGVPADDAYRITKAFAIYFELTNLAETNHRKRRRRAARLQAGRSPAEGSFRGTLARLRSA